MLVAFFLLLAVARAALLVNFQGANAFYDLGYPELEGSFLGDARTQSAGAYIRTDVDPVTHQKALHYHRTPHFRRAEVRVLDGLLMRDTTYYIGYELRLTHQVESLVIFQWKRDDKLAAPADNYPFNLVFGPDGLLTMEYTTPGSTGSNRTTVWRGPFATGNKVHKLGIAVNTAPAGFGWVELWVDGVRQKFLDGARTLNHAQLLNGECKLKFGIYRGEAAPGSKDPASMHTFDSYVYRVQVSDKGWSEVLAAAGVRA